MQRSTLDILDTTAEIGPIEIPALQGAGPDGDIQAELAAFRDARLPDIGPEPALDKDLQMALAAIGSSKSEAEIAPLVAQVRPDVIEAALKAAKDRAAAFDAALGKPSQLIDKMQALVSQPVQKRAFTAARLRYTAARYDMEAKLNQSIGSLYEVQVRKSNLSADRRHLRSQRFFFGMLAAQMAVIVSTFAIAAQKRNLLWSFAAAAGVAAVAFGAWVYLFV